MRWIGLLAAALVALYCVFVAGLAINQRSLIFQPREAAGSPEASGLVGVDEVVLERPDGVRLIGWHLPALPGKPTFVLFTGNASAPQDFVSDYQQFATLGYGLLTPAYRGYAGSQGSPSKDALVADAAAWIDWLNQRNVRDGDLYLWGISLGGAVATETAVSRSVRGVVLEAPFTSLADLAKRKFWFVPVDLFLKDRFEVEGLVRDVKAPILVLHGEKDEIIPVEMGKAVLKACQARSTYRCNAGFPVDAGHHDLHTKGARAATQNWVAIIEAEAAPIEAGGDQKQIAPALIAPSPIAPAPGAKDKADPNPRPPG